VFSAHHNTLTLRPPQGGGDSKGVRRNNPSRRGCAAPQDEGNGGNPKPIDAKLFNYLPFIPAKAGIQSKGETSWSPKQVWGERALDYLALSLTPFKAEK